MREFEGSTDQSEEAKYKMLKWVEKKVQHRLRGKSNKNLRILRESLDRITQITDIPYQENLEGKTYRKGKSTYTRDTRSEAYDSLTDILTTFVSRASLPSPVGQTLSAVITWCLVRVERRSRIHFTCVRVE